MAKKTKAVVEEKAVAPVAQTTAVATIGEGAWGSEDISNSDILISKALLMQGQSELVADGDAIPGQIVDSVSNEVLGGLVDAKTKAKKPIELIGFQTFKTWVTMEKRGEKFEFVKQEPMTPDNENWPQDEKINGIEIRRDRVINCYCLRPEDIKAGSAFPLLISFRRTSYKAGRKLITMAAKLRTFQQPLAAQAFQINVEQMENDKGIFWAFDMAPSRKSTDEEKAECFKWFNSLKKATIKVDDSDLKKEAAAVETPDAGFDV